MDWPSIHRLAQYPWTSPVSMDWPSIHGLAQCPWTGPVSMDWPSIHGLAQGVGANVLPDVTAPPPSQADTLKHRCCGNSSMSGDMYSAGYHSISNVDYSSVCVSAMRARHGDCPGMTWHQMDMRQLSFPDESFDVILEKATLDALMVEEKTPWEVNKKCLEKVEISTSEK
ncbi:Endothelin-converting enzyme 2 [Liparis tanakae]|uniref:Endothelin-converting enzyme 2 n=1 Tax=Liparis tanakae TaxID=230148 RepID=A0A4Z2HS02_9TELE|nr:Endothelin-converting enzyme 2 [Liparis tanakae]